MSAEHEIGKTSFHSQETQVQRGEGTCHRVGDGGGNRAQVSNSGVSEVPVHTHTHARRHTLLFLLRMPTLPVKAWPTADHLLSKNMHTFPSFFATAKFVLI